VRGNGIVSYVDTNGMHGQVVSTVSKNSRNQNSSARRRELEHSLTQQRPRNSETQKLRNSMCSHCVQKSKFQIQRELQNCQNCQNCSIAIKKKRMMNNAQRRQSQSLKNSNRIQESKIHHFVQCAESQNSQKFTKIHKIPNCQNAKFQKHSQKAQKQQSTIQQFSQHPRIQNSVLATQWVAGSAHMHACEVSQSVSRHVPRTHPPTHPLTHSHRTAQRSDGRQGPPYILSQSLTYSLTHSLTQSVGQ